MSVGPLGGIVGSSAGAPLSQTKGSESERAQREQAGQARESDNAQQAERASGIGQTEQDQQTSERDADGRRLWEGPNPRPTDDENEDADQAADHVNRQSKDATGNAGTKLDLTG